MRYVIFRFRINRFMKRPATLLLLFLSITFVAFSQKKHLVEIESSTFTIQGKTNVNTFECELFQNESERALNVQSQWTAYQLSFEGLRLRYEVQKFDCSIPAMNSDMQDLLKSSEYPYLFLEIHNIQVDRSNREIERLKVSAEVTIMLAGVYQKYQIPDGVVINRSEEKLTFRGKKTLKMTDFNIEPPTKFFGMVTVTDELKVEFEINMKVETL